MTEREKGAKQESPETAEGRPDPRAFLASVLQTLEDAPEELTERMVGLLGKEDRAAAIRDLFEELSR